ncbi:MAG: hypothetical protein ACK55Z_16365, partial [bacterium]
EPGGRRGPASRNVPEDAVRPSPARGTARRSAPVNQVFSLFLLACHAFHEHARLDESSGAFCQ